jgi:hypothetical protein
VQRSTTTVRHNYGNVRRKYNFRTSQPLKVEALHSFETSGSGNLATQRNIPGDQNPQGQFSTKIIVRTTEKFINVSKASKASRQLTTDPNSSFGNRPHFKIKIMKRSAN